MSNLSQFLAGGGGGKLREFVSVKDFGAVGDGAGDERVQLLAAIDAAFNMGGADLITSPGAVHKYSGRLRLRPGVRILFGANNQTAAGGRGIEGAQLVALDSTGGIELVAGSHIVATLRTAQSVNYTGPMLEVNDSKSTELSFGRNERFASFDVDIRGNRQTGSQGVVMISNGTGGVSWVHGSATCGEMDYPFTIETTGTGYVNENWLDFIGFDGTTYLRGINNGNEIDGNRIRLTTQTSSLPRLVRAIEWDGTGNVFEVKIWDAPANRFNPSADGTLVLLTEKSGANVLNGFCPRSLGFARNLIVDLAPSIRRNIVNMQDKRINAPLRQAVLPSFDGLMVGDQDDMLAYATLRYTVTSSGTTPIDDTSLRRLFEPTQGLFSVNSVDDFTITIDTGSARAATELKTLGVLFSGAADRPDRIWIEVSSDAVSWSAAVQHGQSGEAMPQLLSRVDGSGVGASRYIRLRVENDTPKRVRMFRFFAMDELVGDARRFGAWLPLLNPEAHRSINIKRQFSGDGYQVDGVRVVRERQPVVADATAGTEVATINAILARLRTHGLIET
jgi:hypothetical protein